MEQVPEAYVIIGDGRVATHMSHYFSLLEIPYVQWARSFDKDRSDLNGIIENYSHFLILLKDEAIEGFILENAALQDKCCIHFSGALSTPYAFGAHPLMTFGPSLYSLEEYKRIPFILDEGEDRFASVFPHLPNPHYYISKELKPFYHALVVMGNNFTTLLWEKLFDEFEERLGLPADVARPILEKTFENVNSRSVGSSLTGPLVRNDEQTIRANLEALQGDAFQEIYEAFVRIFSKSKQEI